MNRTLRAAGVALAFCICALGSAALAAPSFPALSGRVVDQANILSPAAESRLNGELADLEARTGRQLVVATLPSLQGYEIEEFGYQLGRNWKIGSKEDDDGALFIIAPNERKVRIEVGYGLEPVLTDALSSVIIQRSVIPRFRSGDMEGGVIAGAEAIAAQLALPDDQAKTQVARASAAPAKRSGGPPIFGVIFVILLVLLIIGGGGGGGRGRRRFRGGGDVLGSALPWIIAGALNSGGRSHGGGFGGGGFGGGFGGGGFSGGGGSFGGGGASGSW